MLRRRRRPWARRALASRVGEPPEPLQPRRDQVPDLGREHGEEPGQVGAGPSPAMYDSPKPIRPPAPSRRRTPPAGTRSSGGLGPPIPSTRPSGPRPCPSQPDLQRQPGHRRREQRPGHGGAQRWSRPPCRYRATALVNDVRRGRVVGVRIMRLLLRSVVRPGGDAQAAKVELDPLPADSPGHGRGRPGMADGRQEQRGHVGGPALTVHGSGERIAAWRSRTMVRASRSPAPAGSSGTGRPRVERRDVELLGGLRAPPAVGTQQVGVALPVGLCTSATTHASVPSARWHQ